MFFLNDGIMGDSHLKKRPLDREIHTTKWFYRPTYEVCNKWEHVIYVY